MAWLGLAWLGQKDSTSTSTYREDSTTSKHQERLQHQDSDQSPATMPRGPGTPLLIKTDSQSVSGGVIWSLTAKGVGLSVTVPKGVTTSLDTRQYHHDTERRPVFAVPRACRSIVRQRSSVPFARSEHLAKPSSTATADQIVPPSACVPHAQAHSAFQFQLSSEADQQTVQTCLLKHRITTLHATTVRQTK